MLQLYFVKKPLFGIEAGRVERFAPHRAGQLLHDGSIEEFDKEKKLHREAPGSPESDAKARERAASKSKDLQQAQRELHRQQFGARRPQ